MSGDALPPALDWLMSESRKHGASEALIAQAEGAALLASENAQSRDELLQTQARVYLDVLREAARESVIKQFGQAVADDIDRLIVDGDNTVDWFEQTLEGLRRRVQALGVPEDVVDRAEVAYRLHEGSAGATGAFLRVVRGSGYLGESKVFTC